MGGSERAFPNREETHMLILARILGFVVVMMGLVISVNPKAFTAMLNFWAKGNRIYLAGALRLAFGAIFLSISAACRLPGVVTALGVLMIIGGFAVFIIGPLRIQTVFAWWQKRPSAILRLMGAVAVLIGLAIIYSV
jgi:uncharacterized protein YjeT (DUF2065 family)